MVLMMEPRLPMCNMHTDPSELSDTEAWIFSEDWIWFQLIYIFRYLSSEASRSHGIPLLLSSLAWSCVCCSSILAMRCVSPWHMHGTIELFNIKPVAATTVAWKTLCWYRGTTLSSHMEGSCPWKHPLRPAANLAWAKERFFFLLKSLHFGGCWYLQCKLI